LSLQLEIGGGIVRELASWLAGLTLTVATIRYCYLIYLGRIKSSPAGWMIAAIAITIGYFAYWETSNPTWLGNIGQLLGAIEIWFVLGVLMWSLHRKNELGVEFDRFQWGCLLASLATVALWKFTNRPDVAFVLLQVILVISYIAVVGKLITWKDNHDYTPMWVAIFTTSVFGFVPALMDRDSFGIINSIRAILASGITTVIMLRLDSRKKSNTPL